MNAHDEAHPAILPCERPARRNADRAPGGLLSIVVPCHNEEAVVATTHDRLVAAVAGTGMDLEIVYVDDGSRDATLERLEAIAARDTRAVVVELSRNFGQQEFVQDLLGQILFWQFRFGLLRSLRASRNGCGLCQLHCRSRAFADTCNVRILESRGRMTEKGGSGEQKTCNMQLSQSAV